MSRWFRLYDEMLDDPKVQLLSPELFKTWVNVLALACRNGGNLPTISVMAFALRMTPSDLQCRIDELILAGLIDIMPDKSLEPHNWSRRQWKSDDSADRVKRHREKKKSSETAPEQQGNGYVTVTATETKRPQNTESDTDTEVVSPLSPQGANKDDRKPAVAKPKCDPDGVKLVHGRITLDDGNRAFWLDAFGGDGQRLDLALIQAAAYVQPNGPRPLAAQVGAQLARSAAEKRDRDKRYRDAAATNKLRATGTVEHKFVPRPVRRGPEVGSPEYIEMIAREMGV